MTNNETRNKRVAAGLCANCGVMRDTGLKRLCGACAEYNRNYRMLKYYERQKMDQCVDCGLPRYSKTMCALCADRRATCTKTRKARLTMEHRCINCGDGLPSKHTNRRCQACAERQNLRNRMSYARRQARAAS